MTLFAGIIARDGAPLDEQLRHRLRASLSRDPTDTPVVFEGPHWCCAAVDIGAFTQPGHLFDGDTLSLLAGEPLLRGDAVRPRTDDLREIHEHGTGDPTSSPVTRATGQFCVAIVRPAARHVRLVADKMGIRPIYYAASDRFTLFSTTLRVFDALDVFARACDLRGVTEISAFGYPLADRTHYDGLRRIRAAEIVDVSPADEQHREYWRWDNIQPAGTTTLDAARRSHQAFMDGVQRRLGGARSAIAYLSGGLDSRAVVGALVSEGVGVDTFNFAREGTQDKILGDAIAERLGTRHHAAPKPLGARTPDYAQLLKDALGGSALPSPRGSAVVWSGEGGSVALGHVHMHRSVVARLRAGDEPAAIRDFFDREHLQMPFRIFRRSMLPAIRFVDVDGIREELARLPNAEPGTRFHLFLLLNDQRRKLTRHFENIDLNRLEFQLPFFDSDFLETVISVPLDERLEHRFYSRWFEQFDPVLRSVAWQTYPEHDPCPVTPPEGLAYQWDQRVDRSERAANTRALLTRTGRLIMSPDFPAPVLSRSRVAAAAALHTTGIRNYDYALEVANIYHQYWRACKGKWVITPSPNP